MTHEIRLDFYDVTRVAPGVTTDTVGPAINGSTGAQNQYIIDGLKTLRSRRFSAKRLSALRGNAEGSFLQVMSPSSIGKPASCYHDAHETYESCA